MLQTSPPSALLGYWNVHAGFFELRDKLGEERVGFLAVVQAHGCSGEVLVRFFVASPLERQSSSDALLSSPGQCRRQDNAALKTACDAT